MNGLSQGGIGLIVLNGLIILAPTDETYKAADALLQKCMVWLAEKTLTNDNNDLNQNRRYCI